MQSTIGFRVATVLASATLLLMPVLMMPALMPVAYAQDQTPSAPSMTSPVPTAPSETIPDSKLDAAAAAIKRVTAVKEKLAKAPASEKDHLAREANEAMIKAVTDQGLSIQEYSTIITVAQNNPIVRDRLLQRLK